MIKVVNAIILNKENKFLIIKRNSGIHGKKWAFPGGIVEKNEADEKALKREVKEETGLELKKIVKPISNYNYVRENKENTLGKAYLVEVLNYNVKINNESDDFKWVTLEELENLDIISGLEDEALKALYP